MPFDTNVFINCPFDRNYKTILRSIIFTVAYAKLEPCICQTRSSGDVRIEEIKHLISESKYGIHDLSRCRPVRISEHPRFNMPYELGIDVGCTTYGNASQKKKVMLILEKESHHYQKVISDISGQDIYKHDDKPFGAMKAVRDWLSNNKFDLPGPNYIWIEFNRFKSYLMEELTANGKFSKTEINAMPEGQYIPYVKRWFH